MGFVNLLLSLFLSIFPIFLRIPAVIYFINLYYSYNYYMHYNAIGRVNIFVIILFYYHYA